MVLISEAYECNLHPENDDQDSSDLGGTPVHADLTVSDISTISTASTSECNVSQTAPPTQQPLSETPSTSTNPGTKQKMDKFWKCVKIMRTYAHHALYSCFFFKKWSRWQSFDNPECNYCALMIQIIFNACIYDTVVEFSCMWKILFPIYRKHER